MQTIKLPQTVFQALGTEAAEDLLGWLEDRLSRVGLAAGVQISAFVARQKVNVLMLEQVSNLLLAAEPSLVQDAQGSWVWQVPIDFTYPAQGRIACVGTIEVDARYGQVRYDETLLANITAKTKQVATESLSKTP